ncbi:MAG: competence/damage-inducible protein A, partial [Bacteroidales bacterium]|nr:competence/damage-inducible protein A [Bacteroidales bacterium]
MVKSVVCTIGDEILIGQITDSNAGFIARELNKIGVMVVQIRSVGDRQDAIWEAVDASLKEADLLILTGGLGPTRDDITKNTLARYTGSSRFYCSTAQEAHIRDICEKRGGRLFEINRSQADVPETCTVLENKLGTAPGMWFAY